MKKTILSTAVILAVLGEVSRADLAIRAGVLHPVSGASITNAVVVVRGDKITAAGPADSTPIPAGFKVIEAAVVTPGLVDPRTTVGLSGVLNQAQDQDQLDKSGPIQPELRAIDAYNPRDPLVEYARSLGVTTVHTAHAPEALISGQSMVVKTGPGSVAGAVLIPDAMISATLSPDIVSKSKDKPPGTIGKAVAMLRADLIKAQEYRRKAEKTDPEKRPDRDLKLEALVRALKGEQRLLITAHSQRDLRSVLRLAQEFQLKIVIDGASEAQLVLDEIKASGFPVILHPTMARSTGTAENASMATASVLAKRGILFAIQTGFEGYVPKTRILVFEAAEAAANGLTQAQALEAITLSSAKILGLEARIGSVEVGKDADLALWDGDPLEYTTHCVGTVISGVDQAGETQR